MNELLMAVPLVVIPALASMFLARVMVWFACGLAGWGWKWRDW